jgi:hypothetical protein
MEDSVCGIDEPRVVADLRVDPRVPPPLVQLDRECSRARLRHQLLDLRRDRTGERSLVV